MIPLSQTDDDIDTTNNGTEKYNLNEKQAEAALSFDSPLLVLAGAGTGKTKTITSKIAIILEQKRAYPWEILAVTFTNKAANEMKDRIRAIISDNVDNMSIGTFHSICIRILRKHSDLVGLSSSFVVLDQLDQQKVIKEILESARIDTKVYQPKLVLSCISYYKNKRPETSYEQNGRNNAFFKNLNIQTLVENYQLKLKLLNSVDFDDIVCLAIKILEDSEDVRQYYQRRFKYILIDEYQDINSVQYRWIKLITGDNQNICCVGDDDQSIYGWRGAEVRNILDFKKDFPNAKIVRLEQNYRSTTSILSVAYAVISNNCNRLDKQLWTNNKEDNKVGITFYRDSKEEAANVIEKIYSFTKSFSISNQKYSYKDIVILLRSTSQTRIFEEALVSNSIPYRIFGGVKFYERKEIKDAIAYLRTLVSNNDLLAFERVLSYPKKGLGDKTLSEIFNYTTNSGKTIFDTLQDLTKSQKEENQTPAIPTDLFGNEITEGIKKKKMILQSSEKTLINLNIRQKDSIWQLISLIKQWRNMLNNSIELSDILKQILYDIQYEDALKKDYPEDWESRAENINELLSSLSNFGDIGEFLEYTSLITDLDSQDNSDEVSIMTLHASKGLEFPVVFLPSWDEGSFPNQRAIDESGDAGLEEERRLAYVGITRAKEYAFISHSKIRFSYGGIQPSVKSRFITEITDSAKDFVEINDKTGDVFYGRNSGQKFKTNTYDTTFRSEDRDNIRAIQGNGQHIGDKIRKTSFNVGDVVNHKTYGLGKIIAKENLFVTIKFLESDEQKTIRIDFLSKA